MIYVYFETELRPEGDLHRLCLDDVEMGNDPFIIGATMDPMAANAKGQQLVNRLQAGGAQVEWWPL